ncbi:NACHT domain-containing protein [Nocardia sp. NPDC004278]
MKSNIPRTEHGLLDSATLSRDWYPGVLPRRAEDLIGACNSYVLLAPGGAGKTTLVEDLKRCEPSSISIDLRLDGQRSLTELLGTLSSSESSPSDPSGRTVFVDAVDEALQVDSNIGYVLVKLLSRPGSNRMAWRFACRPASWTVDLADGLRTALPGFKELELLPLSLAEIREIAGTDTDQFLAAVEHARLTRLLAHPLHALNLLDHWRMSGQMPASRSEAMRHAVTGMLTETSTTRLPGTVDDHRRLLITERLAAISMFCGVGTFALRPVTPRPTGAQPAPGGGLDASVLAVTSVPTQTEPDLSGSLLNVDDIREVLGTALFAAAGQGTVAFVHQSYAEFLAAAYLARRSVAGQRLVSVLGADVNGLVPGPMNEVLGWLLASGSPVPNALIADNAKQLLSTAGLELVDDQVRKYVVDALLYGAAAGTIDEGWRADTSVLSHPGLATQLRAAAEGASNHWVVFWICRIARQCAVIEAADDLLEIAVSSSWPAPMRAEAIKAFAEVAPRDRMAELAPLLDLGSEADPDDEILAAALRAMLPDAVDFASIRVALRPRRTPNYIGDYYRLLGELPSLVPGEDVLSTLADALRRRPERGDDVFDRLIGGLLRRAWKMRDPASAAVIGAALGSERLSRQRTFRGEALPWQTNDEPAIRRAMATAALTAHEHAFVTVLDLRILTPEDIGWLIDWIRTAPPEALGPARAALSHLAWKVTDAESAERILDTDEDHPAYEVLAAFHGHQEISSRPHWLAARTRNNKRRFPTALESRLLRDALACAREDVDDWWHAVVALAGDPTSPHPGIFSVWDLTSTPMWSTMPYEEQEEFLRIGLVYLHARQPDLGRWLGRDQWPLDDVMPDWAAVFLLATLAAHRPDLLADVEPIAWASWAKVITWMPTFMGGDRMQRWIRDAAPEAGHDALDEALREQVQQAAVTSFAHHPFADFSDSRLLAVVQQVARDADNSVARRDEAISVLIKHAPDIALDVARTAMNEDVIPPAVFTALARLAPDELVAEWIVQGRLGPVERLGNLDPERLSDTSLAALTGILLDELSFAEDPAQSDDSTKRTPAARQLCTGLLQSMAGRGMTSHLAALGHGRPVADLEQIRHLLQQARMREALAYWRPLQPDTLMKLLARGDARLIRNSAGLLTVLLEQLDQIQQDVRGRATFRSLWDGEPGAKGAKPKGEDTISDWLAEQLRLRLRPHVVVDREIQVTRPKAAGVGTRIDITATSGGVDLGRVIFEAKRVNNDELLTAIDDQLVGRYMEPAALTHGIYIVYWTACELRPSSWHKKHPDPDALAEELRVQAQRHLSNKHIKVVVFDIGPTA